MEADLRTALEWIRDNAKNVDAVEARAMCDSDWHLERRGDHERCPVCWSSWWSVDGEPPLTDACSAYAVEAVAAAALAVHRPVGELWRCVERAPLGDFPIGGERDDEASARRTQNFMRSAGTEKDYLVQRCDVGPWQDVTDEGDGA